MAKGGCLRFGYEHEVRHRKAIGSFIDLVTDGVKLRETGDWIARERGAMLEPMDASRSAGAVLEAERRRLAEAVVALQYEQRPTLRERYGEQGREKCIQDTEYHLSILAAAVRFGSPKLFAEYIAWAKLVMATYGVAVEDIEGNLLCLRQVLHENLSEFQASVAPILDAAIDMLKAPPSTSDSFLAGDDALSDLARRYLQALLAADRHEAVQLIVNAVEAGTTVQDIYLRVFQPCQREVGRLWQMKQITVAQEHYCTATTQLAMSQLYPLLFSRPRIGRRAIATSVSGDLHEVGLRVVADVFESAGWDTIYLGANVPESSVLKAIEQFRPDLLLVSATMAFHLNAVERLIGRIRSTEAGRNLKIMVGGYPCNVDSELWTRVQADGYACDAAEAVVVAERLIAGKANADNRPRFGSEFAPGGPTVKAPEGTGEVAIYNELSRLNNELLTAQRELARKNAELDRLNQRLVEQDESKDRFLATLTHEMRNPLNAISNGLELLGLARDDRNLLGDVRNMLSRQTQHLVRLVDDLLDISRIRAGKISLRRFRVELATVVQSALEIARGQIEDAGHELTVQLPQDPLVVEGDPTRLAQIISNLLTNAARYTNRGGSIWLTLRRDGKEAVLSIKDSGVGIPPGKLTSIFEMFAQVERSVEQATGGLGVGLALVRRLTEMHGGSVEARSEGLGRGSEFIVRLPVAEEVEAEEASAAGNRSLAGRLRILVVDDSEETTKMLCLMLQAIGHTAYSALDGLQAVRLAEELRPDLALVDVWMPGLTGYDVAQRIREEVWGTNIVLAAMTGLVQDSDRQKTKEAGFDYHLVKPIDVSTIQELLSEALRRRMNS